MKTARNTTSAPRSTPGLSERLIQRALLLTSQVLGRMIDEGDRLTPEGIHSVRVAIKRLRAGWRLLRSVLPADVPAAAEARLRALHHALAADRARFVRLGTVERLRSASDHSELQALWLSVAAAVQDGSGAEVNPQSTSPRRDDAELRGTASALIAELIGRAFRAESRAWRELNAQVVGAELLPELRRSYRRARRAARAVDLRDAGSCHVWRLRLKRLLHQLELLGIADAVPADLRGQWADIAVQLGRLQDLHDLASHVDALGLPHVATALFRQRLHVDQRQLQRRLRRRGEVAFGLSSRAFASLLHASLVTEALGAPLTDRDPQEL